jgi:hypothetical protein
MELEIPQELSSELKRCDQRLSRANARRYKAEQEYKAAQKAVDDYYRLQGWRKRRGEIRGEWEWLPPAE